MKKIIMCLSLAGWATAAVHAAVITWESRQLISGASDVNTAGTYFGSWAPYSAANGGADTTLLPVNGVTFKANDLPDFSIDSWFLNVFGGYGSPGTPDSNYNTLLGSAQYSNDGSAAKFGWGGMTVGNTYQVQLWVEDTRNINIRRWENAQDESGGSQSDALDFPADGTSTVGMYVLGTFTADAATQLIDLWSWSNSSNGFNAGQQTSQVNLFLVRDITPVPEPSALALLGGGVLVLFWGHRRTFAQKHVVVQAD